MARRRLWGHFCTNGKDDHDSDHSSTCVSRRNGQYFRWMSIFERWLAWGRVCWATSTRQDLEVTKGMQNKANSQGAESKEWLVLLEEGMLKICYRSKFVHLQREGVRSRWLSSIILYVDELIIVDSHASHQAHLSEKFEMMDLGFSHFFLGLEIWQTKRGMFVSQQQYVCLWVVGRIWYT